MAETIEASGYFVTPGYTFWKWEEDGALITTLDDETLVFAPELAGVITQLAPHGLPPLGALLLVLGACREHAVSNFVDNLFCQRLLHTLHELQATEHTDLLNETLRRLNVVQEVWQRLPKQPGAKASVASAVFSRLTSLPKYTDPSELVHYLEQRGGERQVYLENIVGCRSQFLYELGLLRRALYNTTAEELLDRIGISLDDVILAVAVETLPPATTTARDLLREIESDEELSGLARLAKQVLATLNLPRAISDPDELPDGGLSDITNRGALDRLLLSELAHDDLTLAVRVALREALYLRREAPPRTPPRQRTLLVDCGLRLWGVPRLFATSVAMAIASASEENFKVTTYRTAADSALPINLHDRAGLVEHLAALDHRLHPAAALQDLLAIQAQESDVETELVLITSDDTWDDYSFQRELAKLALRSLFVVTVNRAGHYRLLTKSAAGTRVLREATFDLDDILSTRAKQSGDLLSTKQHDDTPAIFRQPAWPLRLPASLAPERAWHVPIYGVLSIAKDGRLLRWNHPGNGAKQLAENLPSGDVHWCATQGLRHYAVFGRLRPGKLFVLALDLRTSQGVSGAAPAQLHPLALSYDKPLGVTGQGSTLFVIYEDQVEVFDAESGQRVCDQAHSQLCVRWEHDRFFSKRHGRSIHKEWYALTYTVGQCVFEPILDDRKIDYFVSSLIDVGDDGPAVVFTNGSLSYLTSKKKWQFAKSGGRVVSISRDKQWFLYKDLSSPEKFSQLVNLKSQTVAPFPHSNTHYLEPLLPQFARPRTLRHNFNGITVGQDRRLTLISRSGDRWPLTLSSDRSKLFLPNKPLREANTTDETNVLWLQRQAEENSPYNLRHAVWPDGSRAVLDSRGLLHLCSSDPLLPEFSIVLAEGETAGWVADGRRWGPTYFHDAQPLTSVADIEENLLRRFVERLI